MHIKIKSILTSIVYIVCIMLFIIDELHMPSALKYVPDLLLLFLLVYTIVKEKRLVINGNDKSLRNVILAFLLYCVLSSLFNGVGAGLFLWAIRCTFRFYAFYYLCIKYLNLSDLNTVFSNLEKLYIVNILVVAYQFFVKGLRMDFLGGIFGTDYGCNGYLNVFMVVMLSYVVNQYFHKQSTLRKLGLYLISSFAIAGMAELKFFYIEALIIFLLALVINKPSVKTISFAIVSSIALFVGLSILEKVFPEAYLLLFDQRGLNNYLSANWAQGREIGRSTAFDFINIRFFNDDFNKKMFGLGFGNCEFSSFFMSDFAKLYKSTNYRNFTFAMQYLETGFVGLILYVSCFAVIFISTFKVKCNNEKKSWLTFVKILVPMILLLIWYSDACKTESAYILFFALASFGIVKKEIDSVIVKEKFNEH